MTLVNWCAGVLYVWNNTLHCYMFRRNFCIALAVEAEWGKKITYWSVYLTFRGKWLILDDMCRCPCTLLQKLSITTIRSILRTEMCGLVWTVRAEMKFFCVFNERNRGSCRRKISTRNFAMLYWPWPLSTVAKLKWFFMYSYNRVLIMYLEISNFN